MEDSLQKLPSCGSRANRTGQWITWIRSNGLPQTIVRDSLQITLCCKERKLSMWWTIRKNGNNDSCRWVLMSWIEWISDWSLVMLKRRCWKQVITFVSVISAMDDVITDGIASGVKLARHQYRLLYGTREVAIVRMSWKTIGRVRITWDSGDGLSCSSDEVVERQWSEGLSLFGCMYCRQPETGKIRYSGTRS
jgi:hypothetical protein